MGSFFELTKEDMVDVGPQWQGGETPTFIIAAIEKKVVNDSTKVLVESVVLDGENIGKKYTQWFSIDSTGGRKALGIFITAFMSAEEAASLTDPSVLINRKWTCVMVANDYNGKTYINPRYIKAISDVPAGIQQPAPTQPALNTTVAQPVQQPTVAAAPQPALDPKVQAMQEAAAKAGVQVTTLDKSMF